MLVHVTYLGLPSRSMNGFIKFHPLVCVCML